MEYRRIVANGFRILYFFSIILIVNSACAAESSSAVVETAAVRKPMIPELSWQSRSDWVNVKTDVEPPAKGDGVADDTMALQKALDMVKDGTTIYIPAGTYRITDTLNVRGPLVGASIIGNGRTTKLVWAGKEGGTMLLNDGLSASRYVGLVFDGCGKSSIGLHHFGGKRFETQVKHQHLAFLNLTDTGILANGSPATAETMTENCLFENCGRGIAFLSFNDYDWTIDGCEFRKCGIGIETMKGNFYARNCHFEDSGTVDFKVAAEHGSSIRRCTSVGSMSFLSHPSTVDPLIIQDCHVSGWTSPAGTVGLISNSPVVMFDCSFTNPPEMGNPPRKGKPAWTVSKSKLFLSQNIPAENSALIQANSQTIIYPPIPAGKRKGSIGSADQSFLKETVAVPTVVFDAKRDFGAKGDRKTDDTVAIQKTIDAARSHGKGAIAYLPTGIYVITSTLNVTGADYVIGGSGIRSGLFWMGAEGGTIIEVQDPLRVTIEQLAVGNHDTNQKMNNAYDILQTGSGRPSSITYDGIFVYGKYQRQPFNKGLWLRGLGKDAVVLIKHLEGNAHLVDSAQATVLMNNSYEGSIVVEGKDKRRDGFLGILSRLCTTCPYALYLKDNHSLVASDFYVEQAEHGFFLEGGADDPPGRLTLQVPKINMNALKDGRENMFLDINGYKGQLFIGPVQYYVVPATMKSVQKGGGPLDIICWASALYNTKLEAQIEGSTRMFKLACCGFGTGVGSSPEEEGTAPEALNLLSTALDDLRELGELDLRLNHPSAIKP